MEFVKRFEEEIKLMDPESEGSHSFQKITSIAIDKFRIRPGTQASLIFVGNFLSTYEHDAFRLEQNKLTNNQGLVHISPTPSTSGSSAQKRKSQPPSSGKKYSETLIEGLNYDEEIEKRLMEVVKVADPGLVAALVVTRQQTIPTKITYNVGCCFCDAVTTSSVYVSGGYLRYAVENLTNHIISTHKPQGDRLIANREQQQVIMTLK